MAEPTLVVYVVQMTEYERGWGQRPDGNLAFVNEADAREYVALQTADRTGPVPDEYVAYNLVGYRECSKAFFEQLRCNDRGFKYFDRIGELST
jgi:hypothetical protein